ncbi:GntR family transcriptional regulator [Clostridium sp. LBM24168]
MKKNIVDSSNNVTLYIQIKNILAYRIEKGIWTLGDLIPTEQELMKEFNVSRTTIRQAISLLVQDGFLEKKQGKGTVVKHPHIMEKLGRLTGFAEEVREKGFSPHSRVLRCEFKDTFFYQKYIMKIPENKKILLVERVRFVDDIPVAVESTYWPEHIGTLLNKYELDKINYYDVLENNNIYLKNAKEQISAVNCTAEEADVLGILPGTAVLEMTRLSFGLDDLPIEYTKTRYRSDYYKYDIELKR